MMRSLGIGMLVLAMVVIGGFVAPSAHAQACVTNHVQFEQRVESNYWRSVKAQVVLMRDDGQWVAHGKATFGLDGADLVASTQIAFDARTYCRRSDFFCTLLQDFDAAWTDSFAMRLSWGGSTLEASAWGLSYYSNNAQCVNNNTVAFGLPGDFTLLLTFSDVRTPIIR